jgi:hypothetical protein
MPESVEIPAPVNATSRDEASTNERAASIWTSTHQHYRTDTAVRYTPELSMIRYMSASSRAVAVCAALLIALTAEYHAQSAAPGAIVSQAEVIVFGATPGGVTAAVSAARAGRKVLLLEPGTWVGGMMSGGLSNTDTGQRGPEVISGLAGEFFRRARAIEEDRGACLDPCSSSFFFEPHVAERVFEAMLREAGVIVERSARLLEAEKNGATITRLVTSRGEVRADVFVDASYEGDLMKMAGVPFRIGREPRRLAADKDAAALAEQEDDAGPAAAVAAGPAHRSVSRPRRGGKWHDRVCRIET